MKFLHIGDNICGIPNSLARAQREAGHYAAVLSFEQDPQGHKSDILIETTSRLEKFGALLSCDDDVFFFVGDTPFAGIDILFWRLLGKKVVIHYHGSEVRGRGGRFFHRFANVRFVSTPDLLEWVPDATWLPSPVFMQDYPQAEPDGVTIVHAPTNREYAGTDMVIAAFDDIPFRLDIVENVPYKDALERYRKAILCIEKLRTVGWYGMVGLECMAMGVPVMCYIKPELRDRLPRDLPLWAMSYVGTHRLVSQIAAVLTYKPRYEYLIRRGKEYVASVHDPAKVARLIDENLGIA